MEDFATFDLTFAVEFVEIPANFATPTANFAKKFGGISHVRYLCSIKDMHQIAIAQVCCYWTPATSNFACGMRQVCFICDSQCVHRFVMAEYQNDNKCVLDSWRMYLMEHRYRLYKMCRNLVAKFAAGVAKFAGISTISTAKFKSEVAKSSTIEVFEIA